MLDIPAQLDWVRSQPCLTQLGLILYFQNLYDSHISAVEMATNNDIWYSGGPAIPYDFGAYPPGSSSIDHESYQ